MPFSYDPASVRMPQLPGMQMPELGIKSVPGIDDTSFIGAGTAPIGTSTVPFLDDGMAAQGQTGLNIQRDASGKIDWLSTIATMGSLAALAYGAAKGNTRLAAAGSGFLQGRSQGLQELRARDERESVRAEARTEREQERALKDQERKDADKEKRFTRVNAAILQKNRPIAESEAAKLPPGEREDALQTIQAAFEAYDKESGDTKQREAELLLAGSLRTPDTAEETAKILRRRGFLDLADQGDSWAQKTRAEGRAKELADKMDATEQGYWAMVSRSNDPGELEAFLQRIGADTRMGTEGKAFLVNFTEAKRRGAAQREAVGVASELLKIGTPAAAKEAAKIYTEAYGVTFTAEDFGPEKMLDPNRAYVMMVTNLTQKEVPFKEATTLASDYVKAITGQIDWTYQPNAAQALENEENRARFQSDPRLDNGIKSYMSFLKDGTMTIEAVRQDLDTQISTPKEIRDAIFQKVKARWEKEKGGAGAPVTPGVQGAQPDTTQAPVNNGVEMMRDLFR
jgi:hypothetical protein